ncbi:hypothetical protein CCACVL1_27230 [Corchorus capsularis]|uniref:Uncharacterized protein n=1 Tax=Corchorus capsularis TaxID=210143 RepID=A0A1R3GBJ1_COCAP|nr:hypothetical protein CCACVL1_27230 [Corchorus capsularis]
MDHSSPCDYSFSSCRVRRYRKPQPLPRKKSSTSHQPNKMQPASRNCYLPNPTPIATDLECLPLSRVVSDKTSANLTVVVVH